MKSDLQRTLKYNGNMVQEIKYTFFMENEDIKKRQATYIAPLQPYTLAAFPPWGILQELVV